MAFLFLLGIINSESTAQEPKLLFGREVKCMLFSVSFSHDGKLLAAASGDGTVKVWNITTRALELDLKGHKGQVRSLAFHPRRYLLATGGADGSVNTWELPRGTVANSFIGPSGPGGVESLAFSHDGRLLASSGFGQGGKNHAVIIWDVDKSEKVGGIGMTFRGGGVTAHSVAFQGDTKTLAVGTHYHEISLWNMEKERAHGTLAGHKEDVFAVSFSADGRVLASGSGDGTVKLWDPMTARETATLKGHDGWVHAVAVRPDGKVVASGSHDKTIRLWDTATGKARAVLKEHNGWIFSVSFSRNGRLLASVGGGDRTSGELKVWEIPEW
ncbi:MAG: WD40 repeat domain-containing protein [Gemmataceae bacterium]